MKATSAFSSELNPVVCAEGAAIIRAIAATPRTRMCIADWEFRLRAKRFGGLAVALAEAVGVGDWELTRDAHRYPAKFASEKRHGPECRLAELSCIDANRPFEMIGQRLTRGRTANRIGERREIGEADRKFDRDGRFLTRTQRKAEGEVHVRRA